MTEEQRAVITKQENPFWAELREATDPTAYKPVRSERVIVACLGKKEAPYYVLKEPDTKSYLRLSERDYALWWQMNGRKSIKDLLYYSLVRYRSLPIGHLTSLVDDLRDSYFLQERPVEMYEQIWQQLVERQPSNRGKQLLQGFLQTEIALQGLDDLFTPLYRRLSWLYSLPMQILFLLVIVLGGILFSNLFLQKTFMLSGQGGWSIPSLLLANTAVILIHELAHGLTTKHVGRELNRGGFLIYWGFPAFFVDTCDTWLSPRRDRIAVSWAGPHSGLIIGGLVGGALTAVNVYYSPYSETLWAVFLYQLGFLAYFSVFVNLNPLLELDGYFILMDWLDIPDLRHRAFRFWRQKLWPLWQAHKKPRDFWNSLDNSERIFTMYGGLALLYATYALLFALYFWQTRLFPFGVSLWHEYGWPGQLLVLVVTAVIIIPSVYYILQFGWSRLQAGLEWLAYRDLLGRSDVLALLIGIPLLVGLPLLLVNLPPSPRGTLILNLVIWLLHIAVVMIIMSIARQLRGSRFQWAWWALVAAPVGMVVAWLAATTGTEPFWRDAGLLLAGAAVLNAGIVSWATVSPKSLGLNDRLLMATMFFTGALYTYLMLDSSPNFLATILMIWSIFPGLMLMSPLLVNFWRSRFTFSWFLLVVAIMALPWLQRYPFLHLLVIALWLYAGLLYLLLGELAQFKRHPFATKDVAIFNERKRLIVSFNHFMEAMFAAYEPLFGNRRLALIQSQLVSLGPLDPDFTIMQIARRCRTALLLAVDRLDDLAGTPFTRKVGQAAYDSLPWLEAETLARHVLSDSQWGSKLAQGFIQARDRRAQLIRQADIFSGFDQQAVEEVVAIARSWQGQASVVMAEEGTEAEKFFLIESGEVGIFQNGVQVATLTSGGYFGMMALRDNGTYFHTYRTLTPVKALAIDRHRFDPLLRADTTLAQQVSSGAKARALLKQMPLFSSLSPQQLATIDASLQKRTVQAGEVIVRQGQPRSHLFIIAEGRIEVLYDNEKGVQTLGNLGPGEHFGEYALFADTPYNATYRAATNAGLLLLDEPRFDRLVAECARMSHYVEQIGSGRLIATRRRLGLEAVLS